MVAVVVVVGVEKQRVQPLKLKEEEKAPGLVQAGVSSRGVVWMAAWQGQAYAKHLGFHRHATRGWRV